MYLHIAFNFLSQWEFHSFLFLFSMITFWCHRFPGTFCIVYYVLHNLIAQFVLHIFSGHYSNVSNPWGIYLSFIKLVFQLLLFLPKYLIFWLSIMEFLNGSAKITVLPMMSCTVLWLRALDLESEILCSLPFLRYKPAEVLFLHL